MAERNGLDTLVVGLDAACPAVLQRVFAADAAPTLESLLDRGAAGTLESQLPPWTPSAWPSLFTGVNPGKHGVYGFLDFDGYDWDVVNRTHVDAPAVWELLDHHGLSSVVVNVPVTHPPREFDGALVPGYVAPEDPGCHPEGLLDDVREAVGEYRLYAPPDVDGHEQVAWYRSLTQMRGETFRYLADRVDPDFGFLQFQQTDTVFHERPGDWDAVETVYSAVDRQVGETLAACDPDAVFVVSDHGVGEYGGYEFRVNDYLRDHGFVETTTEGEGMPSWGAVARQRQADDADGSLLRRALAAASSVGVTSQRVAAVLDRLGLAGFVARRVPADAARAASERVDFPASTAFLRSRIECGVRLNVAGREPDGVVPADEYEWIRGEVVSLLEDARTPDGDPVFDAVLPREEVYHGPHVEAAPDVVVVPAGFDQFLSASLRGDAFGPPGEPWNHKLDGVFAAAGPGVDGTAPVEGAHLFDVAPTVLASLGVPAAERFDGTALPVVDPVGTEPYPEFDPARAAETDDAAVERRLSDLGYLE